MKRFKRFARRLLRKRWGQMALLGGAVLVLAAVAAAAVLSGGEDDIPITQGNHSTVTLTFGGDICISDGTAEADPTTVFLDIAQVLAAADAAAVNLEGGLYGAPYGTATCSAPLSLVQTLADMGVDFIQTANSCAVKNGVDGLRQTLQAIQSTGMTPLGAWPGNTAAADAFTLCCVNGVKVALVAFTKGFDGMGLPSGSETCVNLLYTDYTTTYKSIATDRITAVLEAVEQAQPDITVALVHWGSENNTNISASQTRIAKLMLNNGVDAIIGTHSHQLQQVSFDEEKGTLVAYSLGNLLSDSQVSGNQYAVLLHVQVTKNHDTGKCAVTGWDYTPIYTLTPERDAEALRIVRLRQALTDYENHHISSVSDLAYANMTAALAKIESRLSPE